MEPNRNIPIPAETNRISVASLIDRISGITGYVGGLVMLLLAFVMFYEVVMRKVFNNPTTWVFSISLFALVWFSLLTASYAIKLNRQVSVDLVVSQLSQRARAFLKVITHGISLFFILVLGYYGLQMVLRAYRHGFMSTDLLSYPQWILYTIFPIAAVIISLQLIRGICAEISQISNNQLEQQPGIKNNPAFLLAVFVFLIIVGLFLIKINPILGIFFFIMVLLLAEVPVAFTLGTTAIAGTVLSARGIAGLSVLPAVAERSLHSFVLLAVPLFIMGGVIISVSGVGEKTFTAVSKWTNGIPGGLVIGTIIACGLMSAMVGISAAVVATMSIAAIPLLRKHGYPKELAYGSIAGGALGVLVPPSAGLIVYGFLTNTSVGALFAAGFLPAIVALGLFIIYTFVYCLVTGKYEKKSDVSWKERFISLKEALPGLSIPVIVLGGIYSGVFTPTEAAAFLVVYSVILAIFYKKLTWKNINYIINETAVLGGACLILIMGAMLFSTLIAHLRVGRILTEFLISADLPFYLLIGGLVAVYFLLGMFLNGLAMTVLTVPVLYPVLPVLGIDVIVFGILLMVFTEAAYITPPVGINLFIIQSVTGEKLLPIIKGATPFAIMLFLTAVLLFIFPEIVLWLPRFLGFI